MFTRKVTVTARSGPNPGEQVEAELAICESCYPTIRKYMSKADNPDIPESLRAALQKSLETSESSFLIFKIAGHMHFQCVDCGETYCDQGPQCQY